MKNHIVRVVALVSVFAFADVALSAYGACESHNAQSCKSTSPETDCHSNSNVIQKADKHLFHSQHHVNKVVNIAVNLQEIEKKVNICQCDVLLPLLNNNIVETSDFMFKVQRFLPDITEFSRFDIGGLEAVPLRSSMLSVNQKKSLPLFVFYEKFRL